MGPQHGSTNAATGLAEWIACTALYPRFRLRYSMGDHSRSATAVGADPSRTVERVSTQLAAGRVGVGEAASTLADVTSVAAPHRARPAGQALRLAVRAGDRARAQPGGASPAPSPTAQAAVRTLAITGPTGQLLTRMAAPGGRSPRLGSATVRSPAPQPPPPQRRPPVAPPGFKWSSLGAVERSTSGPRP